MDRYTLAIPLAFILLSAVLCLLLIGSKWAWWQKLALIVIVPGFGLVLWNALGSYKGWPSTDAIPEKSLIYWGLVREPEPKKGDEGAIYIWLMPLDGKIDIPLNPLEYISPGNEPRAYALPYTRRMHEALEAAKAMTREGRPAVLDLTGAEEGGDEDGMQGDPDRRDFKVYDLPPPRPPLKEPE